MTSPYPVRLTQALMAVENSPGTDAVARTVTLEGTVNGVNTAFDIPESHLAYQQVVGNDFTAYKDGVADNAATFAEGTGAGGRDRLNFSVAPATSAAARVLQGAPLNLGAFALETDITPVARVAYTQGLDTPAPRPGQVKSAAQFEMPLMAGVNATRPPPIAPVLKAAGFDETQNGAVWTYALSAAPAPATFYAWLGATVRRLTGALADVDFVFEAGQAAVARVLLNGGFLSPVDADYPTGLSLPAGLEPLCENMDLTLGDDALSVTINNAGGYTAADTTLVLVSTTGLAAGDLLRVETTGEILKVSAVDSATTVTVSRAERATAAAAVANGAALRRLYRVVCPRLSLSLGNEHADRQDMNSAFGLKGRLMTGRTATLSVDIEPMTENERAFWQDFASQQAVAIGFSLGFAAGEKVAITLPAARLIKPQDKNDKENWLYSLDFALEKTASAAALTLTFY